MSLLIDALKRAERAKNGQQEPELAPRSSIERAVDSGTNSLDWSLSGSTPDPLVGNAKLDLSEESTRTEPKFAQPVESVPLREPSGGGHTSPSDKKLSNTTASDPNSAARAREAAQTLFAAKRPAARSRVAMLALFGLAALLLGGGGFYVWYSLAFPPSPAYQPMQARPIPAAPMNAAAPAPQTIPAATVTPSEPIATATLPVVATEAAAANPVVAEFAADEASKSQPEIAPMRKASRGRAAPRRVPDADSAVVDDASSEEIVQREIEQARRSQTTRRSKSARDNSQISVGKSAENVFDPDIALAYNSLLSGNRAEAKRLYSIAAERDPFNTDALLGLASIAGNQGDLNGAERHYRRALELDPQNASALAGLASIRQPGGPSESQLKFELARAPDSAPLRFALGNQYANQGRWDEAQQAYFDAFSLDGRNADYAYNLAVSLDQLEQSKQAITYYRKALDLAKVHGARFRSSDISTRLIELGQAP